MTEKFSAFLPARPSSHHFRSAFAGSLAALFIAGSPVAAGELAELPHTRDDLSEPDRKRVERVVEPADSFEAAEKFEVMQGGAGTSTKLVNRDSLSHFNTNLTFKEEETFKLGNALFRKLWVSSPSSTQASDGLGPLFNARACQSCHIKDGRGHPPEGAADATSMFLRLARPARTDEERQALEDHLVASLPDPVYGGQLQDLAVPGLRSEGRMVIEYREQPVELGDGTLISLRKPAYSVADLGYGPLDPETTLSPRMTPPMTGMGLIEAIQPADILARADPDDHDGDGVSGRVALSRDPATGQLAIGRFGWKAQNATVRQQSASAFAGDIGISTPDVPNSHGDCTPAQTECLELATGVQPGLGDTEAPDPVLELVTFYSENLAVPARRDVDDKTVLAGKQLFYNLGCTSCHTPKFVTSRTAENPAHRFQLIWPYSDILLHDMGEGLADGQQVGVANGREWRTPPLWGIGLIETVNGHTFFLHDGRARNLTEAILWHGGEAQAARDGFAALDKAERDSLLKFLESL
ncbi:MAG: c-type cytochrome [Hoeflea sp.]|nr:c-type cytochrome [Alphaproteobacteria bacterium]MBV1724433.1 c-type cytochrome [Hoeflea sp.]MBU4545782.1 c-type cytochrome [Alphaproteobacteria bacterium]MBU4550751.1 c-type cytochrome [Alphaproteobacteria bacterium]MBV1760453.1 c-type cytochrome [Hoeflea sp.]